MSDTITEITEETILENRRRWAEALRSGEYEQGQRRLCVTNPGDGSKSYCCLGVAELIFGDDEQHLSTSAFPSEGVQHLLGLSKENAPTAVMDPPETNYFPSNLTPLSWLNDGHRLSFAEIADLIDDGQVFLSIPGAPA
jgi:hypothetical protein